MSTLTEDQRRELVLKAIDHANIVAGQDDAMFVRELRAKFFAEEEQRSTRARRSLAMRRPVDLNLKIFEDPRFVRNARALAQRTRGGMRIIGGIPVNASNFQDCVAVGDNQEWFCSGTLIATNAVLTAGHCTARATRIFFGNNIDRQGKIVRVIKTVPHPQYDKVIPSNDLMVLMLASGVTATTAAPRSIAPCAIIDQAIDARLVGFGNTDMTGSFGYGIKRQTDVPIASHSCEGSVDGNDDEAVYGCHPRLELIAGKPLLNKDTCSGDSGGPLYVSDDNVNWFLAGATSRSTKSAKKNCGDGGVYVRVDRYRDWIESMPGLDLPTGN